MAGSIGFDEDNGNRFEIIQLPGDKFFLCVNTEEVLVGVPWSTIASLMTAIQEADANRLVDCFRVGNRTFDTKAKAKAHAHSLFLALAKIVPVEEI